MDPIWSHFISVSLPVGQESGKTTTYKSSFKIPPYLGHQIAEGDPVKLTYRVARANVPHRVTVLGKIAQTTQSFRMYQAYSPSSVTVVVRSEEGKEATSKTVNEVFVLGASDAQSSVCEGGIIARFEASGEQSLGTTEQIDFEVSLTCYHLASAAPMEHLSRGSKATDVFATIECLFYK